MNFNLNLKIEKVWSYLLNIIVNYITKLNFFEYCLIYYLKLFLNLCI